MHQVITSLLLQPLATFRPSSGTQGQIVGGMESLYGWKRKTTRRKVRNRVKSPWGQCVTRPVVNGRGRSGFLKAFVFFCAIRGQQTLESFRVQAKYITFSCSPYLSWLFAEGLCTRLKIQYQNKMQGKTFGKYVGPFAMVFIKSSLFDSLRNIHRFTD